MRGNPHAAFEVAGAGNVAWSRWCDTRKRKGEPTGNTNIDLTGASALDPTCVQRRLVCSAGIKPAGAKVRRPVAWMAGWRETENSEAHRQGLPWGDCESPGRNESEREVASKTNESESRARKRRAKAAWDAEI